MKLPLSWLKDLVPIETDTAELSRRLSVAGLEVENAERIAPAFAGVVVGKVLKVERHPNAERLSLCEVEAGPAVHGPVGCWPRWNGGSFSTAYALRYEWWL